MRKAPLVFITCVLLFTATVHQARAEDPVDANQGTSAEGAASSCSPDPREDGILTTSPFEASRPIPYKLVYGGFRLQVRPDKPHRFGTCVRQQVSHFHIEVFKATEGGRYKYLSNFHIGKYFQRGKSCLAVWNNGKPYMCATTCNNTRSGLKNLIYRGIRWVCIAFGVTIAVGVATALAWMGAYALFPML